MTSISSPKSHNRVFRSEFEEDGQINIPIARVKPLIKILLMNKVSLAGLLSGTDLKLEDFTETDKVVAFEQYFQLVVNARALLPDFPFALLLGEQSFLHHDGLLAARIMSSETVQEAMELLTRFQPLFTQILLFDFEENQHGGVLTLEPQFDLGEALPYFVEFTCSVIYSLGRFFMGGVALGSDDLMRADISAEIHFSYPEPNVRESFDAFFSLPLKFDQPANKIILSRGLLSQKLIFSNKSSAEQNEQICQERVTEICLDNTVLDRVKFMIRRQIYSNVSLDQLAEQLCTSSRTLRRQLRSHNTSYKELLEDERKRVSLIQIRKPEVSLEELADKLGYSDASSFSRAFKRWYGVSPKHFKPKG
jgi:AraC-like DNA-binding protein